VTTPRPPADLADRPPIITTVPTGRVLHRFFTAANAPIHFDRSQDGRLNAPDGTYGVLYAAKRPQGAFAETFLRQPGHTQLAADLIARKAYVTLAVTRPFRLINLHGPGLARLGATAEVTHGAFPTQLPRRGQQRSTPIRLRPMGSPTRPGTTIARFATRCSTAPKRLCANAAGNAISTAPGSMNWPSHMAWG
jgi:hypothetical protein